MGTEPQGIVLTRLDKIMRHIRHYNPDKTYRARCGTETPNVRADTTAVWKYVDCPTCITNKRPRINGTDEDRFWGRVNKSTLSGCWEWLGSIDAWGYGQYWYKGKPLKAHRFIYEATHGALGPDLKACHHCDNRRCVRIDHLFAGTALENSADAVAKGRIIYHGNKRPSLELIQEMLCLRAEGLSLQKISEKVGVGVRTVHKYVRQKDA